MVVPTDGKVTPAAPHLTFADAVRLAANILDSAEPLLVIVDMTDVRDLSTAALAHLVALRLELLDHGRDLHLTGLRGRPLALYRLTRMEGILPRQEGRVAAKSRRINVVVRESRPLQRHL